VYTTNTTWEDTGRLCDHCGGRLLRRQATTETTFRLECERCRCQWTPDSHFARIGRQPLCRQSAREKAAVAYHTNRTRQWAALLITVLLFAFALVQAGLPTLLQAVPAMLGAFAALTVVTFGRDKRWW
jgi:hypothetical protein